MGRGELSGLTFFLNFDIFIRLVYFFEINNVY